ncbi:hypothetical protein F4778DRAFT_168448 [Xylariomycetidae sp. FL2044]|nr:hypothetical protein F4778DRAFT_168448 [Xylariomycetidae sp. FL2044]
MPATTQRRKAPARTKVVPSQQRPSADISSFTRVSKTIDLPAIKKDLIPTPKQNAKLDVLTSSVRKRKAAGTIEDDSSADERPAELSLPSASSKAISQPIKRGRGRPSKKSRLEQPAPKPESRPALKSAAPERAPRKRVRSPSVSDSDEPTINAGALFKKLRLESSPSRSSSPLTANTSIAAESEDDVDSDSPKLGQLPAEVLSLIGLYSSFLKTLSLHYAHNGTNVPVDLRILCPNIARSWGRKSVTSADIRICLGVLSTSGPKNPFSLSNYGRGKVCVEMDSTHGSGPLNEARLNEQFRTNITTLWSDYTRTKTPAAANSSVFTTTLPKAPITLCDSIAKASPVLLRGQQRLEDLKNGIAIKKQEKAKPAATSSATTTRDVPMTNADGTKMSLLDRIRLKSLQKSSLLANGVLTPADLSRRAALQRVEEVSALIGMLSSSAAAAPGERISFAMPQLLEKLKDSFRMGISRDEGAACVRLLAAEVAPEWVKVVVLGGGAQGGGRREMVVVETDRGVSRAEVRRRVEGIAGRA